MANNNLIIRQARQGMNDFKVEVAAELGLDGYEHLDKGELTSRQNGYVGGNMTKKMVHFAEQVIAQHGSKTVSQSTINAELPQPIRSQNETSSRSLQSPQDENIQHLN
jgi:hypothetical protein